MCRSRLAKHLEVCPASVVCCSMEWNRWPLENPNAPLYTNLPKELHEQESLDLSMALRDQKLLCARLKMRKCFPELMEEQEEEAAAVEEYDDEEGAVGKETVCNGMHVNGHGGSGGGLVNGPSKACEKALKEDVVLNGPIDKDMYNRFEKMFSMEMGGCKQAEVEASKTEEKNGKKTSSKGSSKPQGASVEPREKGSKRIPCGYIWTGTLAGWCPGATRTASEPQRIQHVHSASWAHVDLLWSDGRLHAQRKRFCLWELGANTSPDPMFLQSSQ